MIVNYEINLIIFLIQIFQDLLILVEILNILHNHEFYFKFHNYRLQVNIICIQ